MNVTETIPSSWDQDRDGTFFCMTAHLFSADLCCGAGVLLASYDADDLELSPDAPVRCAQPERRPEVSPPQTAVAHTSRRA